MSNRLDQHQLADRAKLVAAPEASIAAARACTDRNFGLPNALHAGFFGLFLVYLGVMAVGFPHPEMILPMVIFAFFTVAFYVVPMLWATLAAPDGSADGGKAMTLDQLFGEGMVTHTGWTSGGSATAQVMVMPVFILLWGIAIVVIAASV